MCHLVVLFWIFTLGQVVGYIGGTLSGGSYDFKMTTILPLITAITISLITHFAVPKETRLAKQEKISY